MGEYMLSKSDEFKFQGRTEVMKKDGATLKATFFSGIVAQQLSPESDKVQLIMDKSGTTISTRYSCLILLISKYLFDIFSLKKV